MKKNSVLILLILLLSSLLLSCDQDAGSDKDKEDPPLQEEPGSREVYRLSGEKEGMPVKVFLELKDLLPAKTDDSPTIRNMEGFLVFDGLTIDMNGTMIESKGSFSVSANGTYNNARLIASMYGYVMSKEVIYSNMNLNVLRDGSPEFTHQLFLNPTEDDVAETSLYYLEDSTRLPFEGWWYELGLLTKEVHLNISSNSYFYAATDHTNNGAVLFVEADAAQSTESEKVWSYVYASDINRISIFDEDSPHEAYPIVYGKLAYTNDASTMYMAFPEDDEYYITKYDLYDLSQGTETAYADEVIAYVQFSGDNPVSTEVKDMDDMKEMARNFSIPADKESTAVLNVYPFGRL